MVTVGTCYVGTGSYIINASACACACTCPTFFFSFSESINWATTSNFEEYQPVGFYYSGHFFKEKWDFLNYKSSVESKETCKFLCKTNRNKFEMAFEYDPPLMRKTQFRGPPLKIRCEQKRKMRLHKNK